MRVNVNFTVDIDPEAWALVYGVDRAEIRADVKDHIQQSVIALLYDADVDAKHVNYPPEVTR